MKDDNAVEAKSGPDSSGQAPNMRSLFIIGLFVVVMTPVLLHFNLLYAPMQGDEFRLLLHDDALHHPDTAITADDLLPGAPLTAFVVGTLWWLGGETMLILRLVSLFFLAVSVALLFRMIVLWTHSELSATPALLGALLLATTPAAVEMLTAVDALPTLMGSAFALAGATWFLTAKSSQGQLDWPRLVLSCCALALAMAAHSGFVFLPIALLALDSNLNRLARRMPQAGNEHVKHGQDEGPETGRTAAMTTATQLAALIATAITVAGVIHYSGGTLQWSLPGGLYLLSLVAALAVAWLWAVRPEMVVRRAITMVAIVAVIAGGVVSFRMGVERVDPMTRLEQQLSHDNGAACEQMVLHYCDAARRQADPEARAVLLQEALAVWRLCDDETTDNTVARRVLGTMFLAAAHDAEAAELLTPFLASAPFDDAGIAAALAVARAAEIHEQPQRVADYYAFAHRTEQLPQEDLIRQATAQMMLGNTTMAAIHFAALPGFDEDSEAGMYQAQALNTFNAARSQLTAARELIAENPLDVSGYVAMAESDLLSGNLMRAFYWLVLALRRDESNMRAWELLGMTFARHDHAADFVASWGALTPPGHEAWLRLARQAAGFRAWDAAQTYAKHFVSDDTPSVEEFMAVFAMEARRPALAREWLEKATAARPDNYAPWLALTDMALAMDNAGEAREFLREAQERNAPEEEVEKRHARIEGDLPVPDETQPFEPVRTFIQ